MKPLLFLDVDGVLNCFDIKDPGKHEHVTCPNGSTRVASVPYGMKDRIQKLLPHFDIVWSTAWLGAAHSFFKDHLGLPDESFHYIQFLDLKITENIKFAGDRPWAWVDDDANWELDRIHRSFREIPNTLIIVPNEKIGLTDEHVKTLLAFAKEQQ